MEIIEPETMPQDVMELKGSVPRVQQEAQLHIARIKDQSTIDVALAWCQDRKREVDAVIARLAIGKKKAWEAYQEWQSLENDATKPRIAAIKDVKARVGTVQLQLNERARKEQEAAFAEEKKKAEEKAKREAAKLEKRGEPELARAALESAAAFVPPVIPMSKPTNGSVRPVWRVRLKGTTEKERSGNMLKLIAFIAGRPDLTHLLQLNVKALETEAENRNGDCPYHGLEFYPEARVSLAPQRRTA